MPSESTQPSSTFYVTTPIYYVNARPHIGHAYTTIVADVLARRHRLLGDDTFFLTGTDEHGQKIERSAAAAGVAPQQFTDQVSAEFRTLWDRMGLSYDAYIRTTDPVHKQGAQRLFADLYERGAIYLSSYTGQYCVSEEIFVEGPPGTIGPDGRPTETVTEENFFFRLSAYQRPLLDLIELDILQVTPEARKNEVLSFLRGNVAEAERAARPEPSLIEGEAPVSEKPITVAYSDMGHPYVPGALRDLSVSRSSFTWGIPVPEAIQEAAGAQEKHVMYVWLDALANYITAIGYGDPRPEAQARFQRYWPANLHIMAKEITRQHCIYWPAFLLAAGLPLPKAITAHGWLLFDNAKMSKSKGNVVRTETILEAFGDQVYGKQFPESSKRERDLFTADVLRYFLLREIPFGQDGSFSFDALVTRYNAELANGYGNLVSRTLKLLAGCFPGGVTPRAAAYFSSPLNEGTDGEDPHWFVGDRSVAPSPGADDMPLEMYLQELAQKSDQSGILREIAKLVALIDGFLSAKEPWKLAKQTGEASRAELERILYIAAEAIRIITALLYPVLPYATARVWAQLGLGDLEAAAKAGELNTLTWGGLKPGTQLGPLSPIFPRADKALAQVMIDMEEKRSLPLQEASNIPMVAEAGLPAVKAGDMSGADAEGRASTDPGAAPRTSSLDEPSGVLTVGGSTAAGATLPTTPGPHTDAPASGVFAGGTAGGAEGSAPEEAPVITIDDFMKVELRVAQVLVAERIPKADKLLRLEVDLGTERRQILSGIAQWYAPEELIGRRIVVVANLAPRKMRGLESHGMLLAASEGADGKPVLATFGEEIALGARVR